MQYKSAVAIVMLMHIVLITIPMRNTFSLCLPSPSQPHSDGDAMVDLLMLACCLKLLPQLLYNADAEIDNWLSRFFLVND